MVSLYLLFFGVLILNTANAFSQKVSFYSDKLKAYISVDLSEMNESNSRACGLLLDYAEDEISHSLNGVTVEGAGVKQPEVSGKAKKKDETSSGNESNSSNEKQDTKQLLKKLKADAVKLIDQKRKMRVAELRKEKAASNARAAGSGSNYSNNHEVKSEALEQLKRVNRTGNFDMP